MADDDKEMVTGTCIGVSVKFKKLPKKNSQKNDETFEEFMKRVEN